MKTINHMQHSTEDFINFASKKYKNAKCTVILNFLKKNNNFCILSSTNYQCGFTPRQIDSAIELTQNLDLTDFQDMTLFKQFLQSFFGSAYSNQIIDSIKFSK